MKKSKRIKPLAIFDIDGTIFRSSLLIELTESLVDFGIFPKLTKTDISHKQQQWLNRKGTYEEYLNQVIRSFSQRLTGVAYRDVKRISRLVMQEQKNHVYVYARTLLEKLRHNHTLVAISGSPTEIVTEFKKAWHFDDVFGTEYQKVKGVYTGKVDSVASHHKKEVLHRYCKERGYSLRHSLGVGDTESDISFLRIVENPIAFNPNKKLLTVARKHEWAIVVERKDVIYTL